MEDAGNEISPQTRFLLSPMWIFPAAVYAIGYGSSRMSIFGRINIPRLPRAVVHFIAGNKMKSLLRLISLTGVAGIVLVLCSPLLYLLLETFPALINVLGLYRIDHFGMIQAFLPDDRLVYRNRPPSYSRIFNLRAANYSAGYGIEVPLHSIRYHFDSDGFRNAEMHESSDVVVIGDSMVEYGDSENDILAAKLERLTGLSVSSLGVGGYGPFQYLEVWKRFGLSKNPKYALLCFYEENDLDDIHEYIRWKKEGRYYGLDILGAGFWKRYRAAVKSTGRYLRAEIQRAIDESAPAKTLPDVADLRMQNVHVQMLLMDKLSTEPIEKTLASEEWASLRQILREFNDAAKTHGVVPIIAYIPLAAHIYAEYSTP